MTKILYTDQQQKDLLYPSRREVLKEIHKRDGLDSKLADDYKRLETGYQGEKLVLDYFKEFGQNHWIIMQNVWLDYYGEFEIDLLVVTNNRIYTFEVKHFSGNYEFKNNQCTRNGQRIGHNAISQAQKSFINTQNLFKRNGVHSVVNGGIIFTGDHCDVVVYDEVADLAVLTTNQLREYIYQIANIESRNTYKNTDSDEVLSLLNQYAVPNPFPPNKMTDEINDRMQKGIICSHCSAPDIYTQHRYLECKCGMFEPRENAIFRTICEYGLIHFDKDLTTGALEDFFNGDVTRRSIFLYLNHHFKKIGTGKGTQYENIKQSLYEAPGKFELKRSRYYKC